MALSDGALLAISDLHVEHRENREIVRRIEPEADGDWLIVCGDVADQPDRVAWALRTLRERFETVIWVPGNHELLAYRDDPPGPAAISEQGNQPVVEHAAEGTA